VLVGGALVAACGACERPGGEAAGAERLLPRPPSPPPFHPRRPRPPRRLCCACSAKSARRRRCTPSRCGEGARLPACLRGRPPPLAARPGCGPEIGPAGQQRRVLKVPRALPPPPPPLRRAALQALRDRRRQEEQAVSVLVCVLASAPPGARLVGLCNWTLLRSCRPGRPGGGAGARASRAEQLGSVPALPPGLARTATVGGGSGGGSWAMELCRCLHAREPCARGGLPWAGTGPPLARRTLAAERGTRQVPVAHDSGLPSRGLPRGGSGPSAAAQSL
jgi:hypothetical protein